MLANGAKLGVKKKGGAQYVDLPGLKELPEMGVDPEKVENTSLTDKVKQYEMGIGDAGDMAYTFKYDNSGAGTAYRLLKEIEESGEAADFVETLKDGTKTSFKAEVSVKRTGGGVNGVIDCVANMALQSELEVVDPA